MLIRVYRWYDINALGKKQKFEPKVKHRVIPIKQIYYSDKAKQYWASFDIKRDYTPGQINDAIRRTFPMEPGAEISIDI